jgi:hypothetical protein
MSWAALRTTRDPWCWSYARRGGAGGGAGSSRSRCCAITSLSAEENHRAARFEMPLDVGETQLRRRTEVFPPRPAHGVGRLCRRRFSGVEA